MHPTVEFKVGDLAFNRRLGKPVRIHSRTRRNDGRWSYAYRVLETNDLYLRAIEFGDLQPITVLDYICHDQEPPPARFLTRTAV